MSNQKSNILIVENQQVQYETILTYLENEYNCFPKLKDYEEFIDCVRVWVNKKYGNDLINIAFLNIIKSIIENDIQLIIMDHILGGAYNCLTGVDLAEKINVYLKENSHEIIPVLFLSRTRYNDKKRIAPSNGIGYNEYENKYKNYSTWTNKGLFGDEILNEDYFRKHILKKIPHFINISETQKYMDIVTKILDSNFNPDQINCRAFLLKIKKGEIQIGEFPEIDNLIFNYESKDIVIIKNKIANLYNEI